ncbi:class I SAM-dependent methyltransferase [Chitinophaga nivalis]|uniref:Class I SAM-dependent methyltransferase n=1 Tax=Chitinophaga nivalis TaxID=2991709 RepID=A0ABT3IIL9_9BACT|nr:class I SAM-dependent methyltransferase [Chitinophaga nivalis]MCW3466513.1 class I SAM-dependent methyltransferase [Chitinophaga nivalis]MCW3483796.1 class I SAM-dependent methyltransferase [Chitinophaga nivalis]
MQPTYSEVKAGWDRAAATDPNPAIHPAGAHGNIAYNESGEKDSQYIIATLLRYGFVDLSNDSIIDFGSGNGRVTKPISHQFKKVYAVDFSYSMLQQLPQEGNIVPVLAVDNWFGLSELVDYAFSISVFIHNNFDSGVKVMKSISDNLKSGGLALLQIPIYDQNTIGQHWTDVSTWTIDQLTSACEFAGFEMVEVVTNPGTFAYDKIGPNHHCLQVLRKL